MTGAEGMLQTAVDCGVDGAVEPGAELVSTGAGHGRAGDTAGDGGGISCGPRTHAGRSGSASNRSDGVARITH